MPAPIYYHNAIRDKVTSSEIDVKYINLSCERVVRTTLAFTEKEEHMTYGEHLLTCAEHVKLSQYVAEQSMTLIKNDNNVLPLSKNIKKLLVVGNFALSPNTGDRGSSAITPKSTVSPMQGLLNYFGSSIEIVHCADHEIEKATKNATDADAVLIFAGCDHTDEGEYLVPDEGVDYGLIAESYVNKGKPIRAKMLKALVMRGQNSISASDEEGKGVGGDRVNLGVRRSQSKMIRAIGSINPNTVVNIVSGSMVMTAEWDDNVPAILMNWYSGLEGGNALARILFGDVNPSGKLPFSVPFSEDHLPNFEPNCSEFTYDYYHGYYLLDKNGIEAMYPFGHGLSYTTFTQENHSYELFNDHIIVNVDVTNTGSLDGKEVIQVYAGYANSSVERHKKELKGFEKVELKAGETKSVSVEVKLKELEYFSPEKNAFVFENMNYELYVGKSSSEQDLVKLCVRMCSDNKLQA